MFLNKHDTLHQLLEVAGQSNRPLLVHTDLVRVGLFEKLKTTNAFLNDHFDVLSTLAESRPLLFSAFNYDFCKNGIYDLQKSPSQVGAFPNFLSGRGCPRTQTPIFNFVALGKVDPSYLPPAENVFGENSVFAKAAADDGDVLLYGANFTANTSIHYAEERMNIGYRYPKIFRGKIVNNGEEIPFTVTYRVRPKGLAVFDYDWDRLKSDLCKEGILKVHKIGMAEALYYHSQYFLDFMSQKMKTDELVYLTPAARAEVLTAKSIRGYPFHLESFEQ